MRDDLRLPREIMSKKRAQRIDLVTPSDSGRDLVHLIIGLEFTEDALLRAAAAMELKHL